MVRRLTAGGGWIRTFGSWLKIASDVGDAVSKAEPLYPSGGHQSARTHSAFNPLTWLGRLSTAELSAARQGLDDYFARAIDERSTRRATDGITTAIGIDEAGINDDRDMLQEIRMVLRAHRVPTASAGSDTRLGLEQIERRRTARRGVRIEQACRTAGYAYISAEGYVGPLAIAPDTDAKAVATTALRCALEGRPSQVSMMISRRADLVMKAVLALGFRIEEPYVLMASRPFGNWCNYLPRTPGFL
jgi:hypothetical protein